MIRALSFSQTWFIAGLFVATTALLGWDKSTERMGSIMGGSITVIQENPEDPQKLLLFQLSEIYSAKERIMEKLPEWAERTQNLDLRQILEQHRKATAAQLDRLRKAYGLVSGGGEPEITENSTIDALMKDADLTIDMFSGPLTADVVMISNLLKIESYEISCYKAAIANAKQVRSGEDGSIVLLEEDLKEDEEMAQVLEKILNGGNMELDPKGGGPTVIPPDAEQPDEE